MIWMFLLPLACLILTILSALRYGQQIRNRREDGEDEPDWREWERRENKL